MTTKRQRLCWTLLLCCGLWSASAQAADARALKVAVIFNILLFVQWPDAAPADAAGHPALVLCADSEGAMWAYLHTLEGRLVNGRPLNVESLSAPDEVHGCHAMVLERMPPEQVTQALSSGMPVLVFSDAQSVSATQTVSLDEVDGHMVFDVDLKTARRSQLQLSSRLLRLARSVRNE